MNAYQRIFGTGPRGLILSLLLLAGARALEPRLGLPSISAYAAVNQAIFVILAVITLAVILWSLRSLPTSERGRGLCTSGAFHYFRHPLYAAFLTFFNFGLALLLNNWIYVVWAVLLHPLWHWNVAAEERMMSEHFPGEYGDYAARTGRFVPRFF